MFFKRKLLVALVTCSSLGLGFVDASCHLGRHIEARQCVIDEAVDQVPVQVPVLCPGCRYCVYSLGLDVCKPLQSVADGSSEPVLSWMQAVGSPIIDTYDPSLVSVFRIKFDEGVFFDCLIRTLVTYGIDCNNVKSAFFAIQSPSSCNGRQLCFRPHSVVAHQFKKGRDLVMKAAIEAVMIRGGRPTRLQTTSGGIIIHPQPAHRYITTSPDNLHLKTSAGDSVVVRRDETQVFMYKMTLENDAVICMNILPSLCEWDQCEGSLASACENQTPFGVLMSSLYESEWLSSCSSLFDGVIAPLAAFCPHRIGERPRLMSQPRCALVVKQKKGFSLKKGEVQCAKDDIPLTPLILGGSKGVFDITGMFAANVTDPSVIKAFTKKSGAIFEVKSLDLVVVPRPKSDVLHFCPNCAFSKDRCMRCPVSKVVTMNDYGENCQYFGRGQNTFAIPLSCSSSSATHVVCYESLFMIDREKVARHGVIVMLNDKDADIWSKAIKPGRLEDVFRICLKNKAMLDILECFLPGGILSPFFSWDD